MPGTAGDLSESRRPTLRPLPAVASLLGLLVAALALGVGPARAQFTYFEIPEDITWRQAQQQPFNEKNFIQSVDYTLVDGGIAPLDTTRWYQVPVFVDRVAEDTGDTLFIEHPDSLAFKQRQEYEDFYRRVSRDSVFAARAVTVAGETVFEENELLLAPLEDFPRDLTRIRLLRLAGIDSLRSMVNLANAVLGPRDPQVRFENWLMSPTIYERQLNQRQKRDLLGALIDDDPINSFRRVDGLNRPVEKRAVVIIMDLTSRFPIGLIRFYPRPEDNPVPISAFGLETHDGVTYKRGQDTQVSQARVGSNYLGLGAIVTTMEGGLPVYSQLVLEQSNTVDTVAIELDPPEYMQRFKFRSLTGLDYDIAEFEIYNQGFIPLGGFTSRPLPMDKAGLSDMLSYIGGDFGKREDLNQLEGGTLGRIAWEEGKIGDPGASKAVVSIQTGFTPEPLVLYRLNVSGDIVEWAPTYTKDKVLRERDKVVDRRPGSTTFGRFVHLDDPLLRASARDIWNALSDDERAQAQTTFPEYMDASIVPSANRKDRQSNELPRDPDPVFWSGFQPVTNGQLITVPGERPFFQLQVVFTSTDPGAATTISRLRIEQAFPPALQRATAEIIPAADVIAGVDTSFTYSIRPLLESGDPGFNRIRVNTPTAVTEIKSVDFAYGLDRPERRESAAFSTLAMTDSFFVLGLDDGPVTAAASQQDSLVVLVDFVARVLDAKTTFGAHVFLDALGSRDSTDYSGVVIAYNRDPATGRLDTVGEILPQRVRGGDVLDFTEELGDRNTLSVVTSVERNIEDVLVRAKVTPNPFTPNGDTRNDVALVSYDVLRVVEPVPVEISISDLSGRRVRTWTRSQKVGSYSQPWNGRDDNDNVVPPGIYLVRLTANTDGGDIVATRTVSVVY